MEAAELSNVEKKGLVALRTCLAQAGWEIAHIDLDLTTDKAKAEIKLERHDGRWIIARVDALGRAGFETFQRDRTLKMSSLTKGKRPLSPQVDDVFLGRQRCLGARHMLAQVSDYIADNSLGHVSIEDMRHAWAGAMREQLLLRV